MATRKAGVWLPLAKAEYEYACESGNLQKSSGGCCSHNVELAPA
jgi:hypothetical protein